MKFLFLILSATAISRSSSNIYQVYYSGTGDSDGDATIFLDEPDQAAGSHHNAVGCNGDGKCARSLFHFHVETMPDDAVISDVKFAFPLCVSVESKDAPVKIDIHQVTTRWTRTEDASFDKETFTGELASMGDVTWTSSSYGNETWQNAGGDFNSVVMTNATSAYPHSNPLFFDATDEFKAVLNGWIDLTIPNYGILMKHATEDPTENGYRAFCHESSGNPRIRSPKLLITYSSESQPDQMPSENSGPGILLPNEPTPAPYSSRPTTAFSCVHEVLDADTKVLFINPDQDATIFKDQADISADGGTWAVGISKNGIRRGLVHFPLESIPMGSNILCAEVIAYTTGPCGPCQHKVDISMHRVTSKWESTGTNDFEESKKSGNPDQIALNGVLANTGDVTWSYTKYNAMNPTRGTQWNIPGGDYDRVVLSAEVDFGNHASVHKFPSTDEFVATLQDFIDGIFENHGFLFKSAEDVAAVEESNPNRKSAYRVFHGMDQEEGKSPVLVIHYKD